MGELAAASTRRQRVTARLERAADESLRVMAATRAAVAARSEAWRQARRAAAAVGPAD